MKITTEGFIPANTVCESDATIQKLSLANALANEYSVRRSFQEIVLRILANAESSPDNQLIAIEKYIDSLPYRREPIEILRNPEETLAFGGDCDDLATAFVACALAVAIPAEVQGIENEKFGGFHLRALAYLPPDNPEFALAFDPVFRSEREWVMYDLFIHGRDYMIKTINNRITKLNSSLRVVEIK